MQIVDKDPSVTEHVMKLGLKNHASEFVLWFSIHQSSISQNALFGNHRSLEGKKIQYPYLHLFHSTSIFASTSILISTSTSTSISIHICIDICIYI